MLNRNGRGFTRIGLMIVVVVVGVLTSVAAPNYASTQSCALETIVRSYAHVGQLYTEQQGHHCAGRYPSGIAAAMNGSNDIVNPFGGFAFLDGPPGAAPGMCYRQVGNPNTSYTITANGRNGTPILVLTNHWR